MHLLVHRLGFVAVVNCEIYKKNKDKQLKVPFNLVDMAGEDFQNQIVQIDDLGSANISFDSMGQGAPEILANDHDKVFFVLIDPTAVGSRDVIQKDAIRTLVGLFGESGEQVDNEARARPAFHCNQG